MKKYASYLVAAGLFLFIGAVYLTDMSLFTAARADLEAEGPANRSGVVIYLEEDIKADFIVNINTAGPEELISLPQIGEVRAQAIIDYREQYGSFISVEELAEVDGISENLLENIRAYITV